MDKHGVELALNTIIISIIGLLVLATAFYLIARTAGYADQSLPETPNMATQEKPVVVVDDKLKAGRVGSMRIDVYNAGTEEIAEEDLPSIECAGGLRTSIQGIGQKIGVGESATYTVMASVPPGTAPRATPARRAWEGSGPNSSSPSDEEKRHYL